MKNKLSDVLQIWGYEEDYMIFKDGSMGFALELEPIDIACWDNDGINELSESLCGFLNGLPSGIDIQFYQDITKGNSHVIDSYLNLQTSKDSEILKNLIEERVTKYTELDKEGLLPKQVLKIFVRRKLSSNLVKKKTIFSNAEDFPQLIESQFKNELNKLQKLEKDLKAGLTQLGVAVKRLQPVEINQMIYNLWNPSRKVSLENFDSEDVRSSLIFTDASVYEKGFNLGDFKHRVVSLKLLPDQTFSGMAEALRDLPFDSKLFLSIHVPDQKKEIEYLQMQRRLAFSMVQGKQGVSDLESEAKFNDLEELLAQMIAQGEKVFHVGLNILLRHTDEEKLDEMANDVLLKLRSLSGAEGMEETLASFDTFTQFSVPNSRCKERVKRVKTSNLADFLPIYGAWQGFDTPRVLLRSRYGNLVRFDPFSPQLSNYNQIISGGSGSGKSFLTNILLSQMLGYDPKVYILDIGGSYKKTCENLNGQYVALGVNSGLSINPFDLKPDQKKPDNHKIKFLVGLVEMMVKEEGDSGLKKLERAELEAVIEQVYFENENPSLSSLQQLLLKHSSSELQKIGQILKSWCGDSPYGQFIDKPTTLNLNKNLVCFDLKDLESYEDLQAVCLFIVTDFIWREVQANKDQMKFIVFDECWKLLSHASGAKFISELYRTLRKYYASAIGISQNIDDFANSKVGSAIMPNSSIKWILKQKGADKRRLQEVLELNESEMMQISSLSQEKGLYSEAFLMCEDMKSVVAIESSPFEYWLATTNPSDIALIEKKRKEFPELNQTQLLKKLSEEYPRGV